MELLTRPKTNLRIYRTKKLCKMTRNLKRESNERKTQKLETRYSNKCIKKSIRKPINIIILRVNLFRVWSNPKPKARMKMIMLRIMNKGVGMMSQPTKMTKNYNPSQNQAHQTPRIWVPVKVLRSLKRPTRRPRSLILRN